MRWGQHPEKLEVEMKLKKIPNQAWSAGMTYIWIGEVWLYLAVVLDYFNRELVC